MLRHNLVSLALTLLVLLRQAHAVCYMVDGSEAGDATYQPCNSKADVSACCSTNKGAYSDICLSSGLCLAQENGYEAFIYSNGCTDQTGQSSSCPHFCPDRRDNWNGGPAVRIWNILQCNPGVYCCRAYNDTTNCCSNATVAMTLDMGLLQTMTTAPTSGANSAATATTTFSSPATPYAAPSSSTQAVQSSSQSQTPQCKDNSAVVGGTVGGILGAALVASLAAVAILCRRRSKQSLPQPQPQLKLAIKRSTTRSIYGGQPHLHELNGDREIPELLGSSEKE